MEYKALINDKGFFLLLNATIILNDYNDMLTD